MRWNWQQADWGNFRYDAALLEPLEQQFLHASGMILGVKKHLSPELEDTLRIELISNEALKTSEIEGEFLDRQSVQSSLQYHFGLRAVRPQTGAKEHGIAELMRHLYLSFAQPLSKAALCQWHRWLMQAETSITPIGDYRRNPLDSPMQVVSGAIYKRKVHFEAPPSHRLEPEMRQFFAWFNASAPYTLRQNLAEKAGNLPEDTASLSALVRAGIAHLYFVSIHPFEDGNGRIARAIAEKAIAQALGQPSLLALAYTIQQERKSYYAMLERANKHNDISEWLLWFAHIIIQAQETTLTRIEFLLEKTKFYDRFREQLNERQAKVIARVLREGADGFRGGLSAANYKSISQASESTVTRDLQDLVQKGVLLRTGQRKSTRYHLPFMLSEV